MPGLAGIIKEQGVPVDLEQLLTQMCNIITYEDFYKTHTFVDEFIGIGRVSLGTVNPEPQPIFNQHNNLFIMMEGEIYDYADLKKELSLKGHLFLTDNDPEFILHLYEEYKSNFADIIKKLNGIFLFAIYDCNSHKLIICNDRYGLKPLYYSERDNYLLFSSEIKAILQDQSIKRKVNLEAMRDFFSFGYILGDKTLIEDIILLPPASIFTYSNSKIEIEHYWSWNKIKKMDFINEEEIVDELGRLWLQAVERRMEGTGKIGAFLSGGLDSRAIVSAIDPKHFPIHSLTFGKRECEDNRIAKEVSKILGLEHHFREITAKIWFSGIERTVWVTEGSFNVIHIHSWDAIDDMKDYCDINLYGFAGDLVLGGSYLSNNFTFIKSIDKYIDDVFLKMTKEIGKYEDKIYSNSTSKTLQNSSRFSLEKEIKRNVNTPVDSDYFFLNNRVRRFTLMGTVSTQTKFENRKPFFDNDLIEFVYGLPNEIRLNGYIYHKMLVKFFPSTFKSIPWQKTGISIDVSEFKAKIYLYWRCGKSRVNKLLQIVDLPQLFNNMSYVDYDNWMRDDIEIKNYIQNILLSQKSLDRGYFNPNIIKEIIDEHMSKKKNYSHLIGMFLTFELFNRMFIDTD